MYLVIMIAMLVWVLSCAIVFAEPSAVETSGSSNCHWRVKSTAHFQIMYKEECIDAEKIYQQLSEELDLTMRCSAPKIKLFIDNGCAYVDPGKKKIVVADEIQLRRELTRLMFYQLCPSAPMALQEAIAFYKEHNSYPEKDEKIDNENPDYQKLICTNWVGKLIEEEGIEKFKQFYKLCTHETKIRLAYQRIYQ